MEKGVSMNMDSLLNYLRGGSSHGYRQFGAHPVWEDGIRKVRFSVYAPYAQNVALIGTFNRWQPWQMQRLDCGVWTLTSSEPQEGQMYKYQITTADGQLMDRADPFAFGSELRPGTASVIRFLEGYRWQDEAYMAQREKNYNRPMNIYELHAGSWRVKDKADSERFYSYDELAQPLIEYVQQMGYTHIELLPLTEHPLDASWGYQVSGYFSATSRYGSPVQLMQFIDRCHQAGIGVILDFVPTHFVLDSHALLQFDGSCLYEPNDPNARFSQWGSALFDFTKPHVLSFLRSSLDFWCSVYHFDGIRYDAVSNLIYHNGRKEDGLNEPGLWFLRTTNYAMSQNHPQVMLIAEDSSDFIKVTAPVVYGGLGFDYKWDLGWMNDTLDYFKKTSEERKENLGKLTFSMMYAWNEHYILPFSHDENVHGKATIVQKMYGDYEGKFPQARALYLYMAIHPGKKLDFMGNEFAQLREFDESREQDWMVLDYPNHNDFRRFRQALNRAYCAEDAFWRREYDPSAFQWLDCSHPELDACAILRQGSEAAVLAAFNFGDTELEDYTLTLPVAGKLTLLLDTDWETFGGSTAAPKRSCARKTDGELKLTLPPFSGRLYRLEQA